MNVPPSSIDRRSAIVLLIAVTLAVAGVAAAVAWRGDDARDADAPGHEDAMDEDARCAHMPEHCREEARAHG